MKEYKDMSGNELAEQRTLIKWHLLKQHITYDLAKDQMQPIVDEINRRGKEIAKNNRRPFTKISVEYVLR